MRARVGTAFCACFARCLAVWLRFLAAPGRPQIIMEYCAGGSVSDLYDATQRTLDQEDIRVILAYTVLGLHHLHTHNSIHRVGLRPA